MGDRTYSFDANLLLADGAAAITADGYTQVASSTATLNLGGNQSTTPTQQARLDAVAVIEVSAIDIASTNEIYRIKILGSNDVDWGSGNIVELAALELGYGAARVPATLKDSVVGEYELFFSTEQAGTKYQYIRQYVDVSGTSPSITHKSYVAVLP
jgi:hypothetical protein